MSQEVASKWLRKKRQVGLVPTFLFVILWPLPARLKGFLWYEISWLVCISKALEIRVEESLETLLLSLHSQPLSSAGRPSMLKSNLASPLDQQKSKGLLILRSGLGGFIPSFNLMRTTYVSRSSKITPSALELLGESPHLLDSQCKVTSFISSRVAQVHQCLISALVLHRKLLEWTMHIRDS